jgi:hypothetical protein
VEVGTEQHDAAWLEMGQCTRGLRVRCFVRLFSFSCCQTILARARSCHSVRLPASAPLCGYRVAPGRTGASEQTWSKHRAVLSEYFSHYNTGRSHQGDGMELRAPNDAPDIIVFPGSATGIQRRARLAGLINEYRQAA